MKKIWNSYRSSFVLLLSIVVGGLVGLYWGEGVSALQPIADTFLNLLYVSVVPLIFFSLTAAIANMDDMKRLGKILGYFMVGTIITGVVAAIVMIIPLIFIDPAQGVSLDLAGTVENATGSMNILAMFTVDDFPLLFSRNNLMALIVFTIIFGIAIINAGEKARPIVDLMDNISDIIVNVINIIMKLAPIGLGSYFAILIGTTGSEVIGPLSRAILIYLVTIVIYFIVSQTAFAYIGDGMTGVHTWWKTFLPPTLTALGTSSSAASIPVNMKHAKDIGIPDEITDLVIPLGANLHKDGAVMIQILKIAFLSSIFGVPFVTVENLLLAVLVSVVVSVIMGGIPGGGYVAEIFIISAFGFPESAIPIMILIGTITDALTTVVNVTGDSGLAMVITRLMEGKGWINRAKANN